MSKLDYPDRIFSLSDCHGGKLAWHPIESPDVAARLAEGIRSGLSGLQQFDTYGVPDAYYEYLVREAVRLHRENSDSGSTGLFINSAPRTEVGFNGQPFYRVDCSDNLVIVATPLSVLSAVRDDFLRLEFLPNVANGLYGCSEQHRSSYAVRLLAENHGLDLERSNSDLIPRLPVGARLAYIDRFGNLVIFENDFLHVNSIRSQVSGGIGCTLGLKIGQHIRDVSVVKSLSDAVPGSLVAYSNDGNVEVVRKWGSDWNLEQRVRNAAYFAFGCPDIGDKCELIGFSDCGEGSVAEEVA